MKNRLWLLLVLGCCLALLVACGGGGEGENAGEGDDVPEASSEGPSATAPAGDVANAGKITGTVSYAGGSDPDTPIAMNADPVCAGLHSSPVTTQTVEAKDGKLANVFVYVKSGLQGSFPAPTEKKTLDQQGCQYHPHVFGLQVGQPLVIKNSDATLHNIHALPKANAEFNQGQPFQNMEFERKFDKPEVMVQIKCDVHPWMSAYVGVVPHPYYAVSGENGTFEIANLPPGTYTVEAWHETMGTQTQQVTVDANGTATWDISFPGGGAAAPAATGG